MTKGKMQNCEENWLGWCGIEMQSNFSAITIVDRLLMVVATIKKNKKPPLSQELHV